MSTNPNFIASRINPLARPALAARPATMPRCPECGRRFDLLDPTDAEEWYDGHDCEAE